jgi:hypothetical protein
VKTTWTSGAVTVGHDSPDGPVNFDLKWTQKYGTIPSGADKGSGKSGVCTAANTCTGPFGTVQRAFNGAYDQSTSSSSRSGLTLGATVTDTGGNEVMSVQRGTSQNVVITVNVLNLGFQDATSTTAGNPVVLHTSGSQGTFAIECDGNNGASFFTTYMASGCPQQFATTTQPNPPICGSPPPGPSVCVTQNPGNGKAIEPGINERINGSETASTCVSPNHWTSPNEVSRLETEKDPRLVQLLIVDSSAWVGVSGASTETPVRQLATFYITGWSNSGKGADPCISQPDGIASNELHYTHDDNPGAGVSNVLLGHFVHWVATSSSGTGGGTGNLCSQNIFGNCIAVLTK